MITENEKNLISQIAMDSESGNHLLRGRSDAYWKLLGELIDVINKSNSEDNLTERESELISAYKSMFYD